MLTWSKNTPSSLVFSGTDEQGNVAYTATLAKTSPTTSTLSISQGGSPVGTLNIPGDFVFAKELLTGIGQAI